MNTHKNARLTYLRRLELVQDITLRGMCAADAAAAAAVSVVTARKWLGRYLIDGAEGLLDKSSKPAKSPRAIDPAVALAIVELRRKLFLQAHIASYMGVSKATVSRVLRRAGLSKLSDLRPRKWSSATSAKHLVTCCTSTSRSSGASRMSVIESLATIASEPGTSDGSTSSLPSTTTRALPSRGSIPMSAGRVPSASSRQRSRTTPSWV